MLLLLVIWGAWFFAAGIPIRQTSASAEVTSPRQVTAVFPSDSSVRINRGQAVNFHPAGNIGAQIGIIPGIVARVSDDSNGKLTVIEITLRFEQSLPAPLQKGLKGQVDIELEEVSPATLKCLLEGFGILTSLDDHKGRPYLVSIDQIS